MTFGELLDAAVACRSTEEADALINAQIDEVCHTRGEIMSGAEARKIVLQNIGYLAGYCDSQTADRIYELFDTQHPVFGRIHPSPEEAFHAGMEMARKAKSL